MTDAFDSDVLIYAATPGHPLGQRVLSLFAGSTIDRPAGIGSVLLYPEVMSKPMRAAVQDEMAALSGLLARLDLRPLDRPTSQRAAVLGARFRLRAADAVHLATATAAGADRFITNNRRDFGRVTDEIEIVFPDQLPQV